MEYTVWNVDISMNITTRNHCSKGRNSVFLSPIYSFLFEVRYAMQQSIVFYSKWDIWCNKGSSVDLHQFLSIWCLYNIDWHWVWYKKILHSLEKYFSSSCDIFLNQYYIKVLNFVIFVTYIQYHPFSGI